MCVGDPGGEAIGDFLGLPRPLFSYGLSRLSSSVSSSVVSAPFCCSALSIVFAVGFIFLFALLSAMD